MHPHDPARIHRPRVPIGLVLAVAALALLLAGALFGWAAWQFAILEASAPLIAGVLRIALLAAPLIAGGVGLGIAWRRWASIELLRADRVVALTQAQQQKFPAALQSLSYHDSSRPMIQEPDAPLALPEPAPAGIPTFGQLLDAGRVGPGRPLLLGFDAQSGAAIEGSWDDLYSVGIGALQGAGKSWLAAFLLAQSVLQGARLIVCDLHAGHSESLATRIAALSPALMCDVASTPDAILSALKLASGKLAQRVAGQGGAWPIIVAVDEWTSLLRTTIGDVLPGYVEDFAEQGRKFNVNAMLSAQGWTIDSAGTVRNRLTSHYVLRQRPDEARYQLGLQAGQLPLDVRFLREAEGYLLDVRGTMTKVVIPHMISADLARVGAMIERPSAATSLPIGFRMPTSPLRPAVASAESEAGMKRPRSGNEAASEAASSATGRQRSRTPMSPESARVFAAWQAGRDVTELAKEANGGSASGDGYRKQLREINALLREATKEGD